MIEYLISLHQQDMNVQLKRITACLCHKNIQRLLGTVVQLTHDKAAFTHVPPLCYMRRSCQQPLVPHSTARYETRLIHTLIALPSLRPLRRPSAPSSVATALRQRRRAARRWWRSCTARWSAATRTVRAAC
jgi:hypothetical protein